MYYLDYYSILGLGNPEKNDTMTQELVKEKYRQEIQEIDRQLKTLNDNKTLSMEEKLSKQKELMEYNNKIRTAYEYCKEKSSISLRNAILKARKEATTTSLSTLREKTKNKGEIVKLLNIKPENKLNAIDKEIKTLGKLYSLPFSNQVGATDLTLSNYQITIADSEQENLGYTYDFFAGEISVDKLKNDMDYRKIFLQTLEREMMKPMPIKYLGYIVEESDRKYTVVYDEGQKNIVQTAGGYLQKKKKEQEIKKEGEDR